MKRYLIFILSVLYVHFSFSQKQYSGLYQGTFWGNRCIVSVKVSNGAVAGALYTGRNTHYSIVGMLEGAIAFRATFNHNVLGNGEIIGSFRNDSMVADAVFEKILVPLRLKKISKNTVIDFDKYFGKPVLDSALFSYWQLVSELDRAGEPIKSTHKGFLFRKDGNYWMNEIIKSDFSTADISWYTTDKHAYINIKLNTQTMEFNMGKYTIKNDTLFLAGAGMFEGTKSVYVKSKEYSP